MHEYYLDNYATSPQIDSMVLEMCKKYVRGVCGNLLDGYDGGDKLLGENFEVRLWEQNNSVDTTTK